MSSGKRKLFVLTPNGVAGWRQRKEALAELHWLTIVEKQIELAHLAKELAAQTPDWVLIPPIKRFGLEHLRILAESGVKMLILTEDLTQKTYYKNMKNAGVIVRILRPNDDIKLLAEYYRQLYHPRGPKLITDSRRFPGRR